MKSHRILITSAGIFTLFLLFTPLSEARSPCSSNKIFNGHLSHEWFSGFQHKLLNSFHNKIQTGDTENFTPFYNRSNYFRHHDEIFSIPETGCVSSKRNIYTGTSQRPPPLSYDPLYI